MRTQVLPATLRELIGEWAGTNRLWLSPKEPARHSDTTASVAVAAQSRFATIKYTWADGDQPQDGLLILGADPERKTLEAVWVDSWHMADKFMLCKGTTDGNGVISVQGSYPAPPGPDWGWRMVINPCIADRLELRMYNISPGGEQALAVEVSYSRRS